MEEKVAKYLLRKYAYPHDDLTPVSMSYVDSYGGWGASVVDAMTTMVRKWTFATIHSRILDADVGLIARRSWVIQ